MKKTLVLSMLFSIFLLSASSLFAAGGVYIGGGYQSRNIAFTNVQLPGGVSAKNSIAAQSLDFYMGYKFNSHFRADIQYMMINKTLVNANNSSQEYYYKSNVFLANLFYDLFDVSNTKITPYIGAGLGVASPSIQWTSNSKEETIGANGFTYQLHGGLNILLFDSILLSLKYSYLYMPSIDIVSNSKNFEGQVHSFGIGISLLV
ncbi:MAG: outer membrane beta-barrel protein [Elusimicrobiota bacterium]|jgi:opacity protein-like surface antigen|nr:outer membrane beta-barrel protein [Elusimicrobiota bacterium]